jgi:hypothetical protein
MHEYPVIITNKLGEVNILPWSKIPWKIWVLEFLVGFERILSDVFYCKLGIAKCKLQIEQEEEALAGWGGVGRSPVERG